MSPATSCIVVTVFDVVVVVAIVISSFCRLVISDSSKRSLTGASVLCEHQVAKLSAQTVQLRTASVTVVYIISVVPKRSMLRRVVLTVVLVRCCVAYSLNAH